MVIDIKKNLINKQKHSFGKGSNKSDNSSEKEANIKERLFEKEANIKERLFEKELEKRERLIQTYIVIFGLLLAINNNEKAHINMLKYMYIDLSTLFIFFLSSAIIYYCLISNHEYYILTKRHPAHEMRQKLNKHALVISIILSYSIIGIGVSSESYFPKEFYFLLFLPLSGFIWWSLSIPDMNKVKL